MVLALDRLLQPWILCQYAESPVHKPLPAIRTEGMGWAVVVPVWVGLHCLAKRIFPLNQF